MLTTCIHEHWLCARGCVCGASCFVISVIHCSFIVVHPSWWVTLMWRCHLYSPCILAMVMTSCLFPVGIYITFAHCIHCVNLRFESGVTSVLHPFCLLLLSWHHIVFAVVAVVFCAYMSHPQRYLVNTFKRSVARHPHMLVHLTVVRHLGWLLASGHLKWHHVFVYSHVCKFM